jgi:hypothetical protein
MSVFISHASADKPFVSRLVIHLINSGIPVWYDMLDLEAGDSLTDKISAGVGDSDYFLIALSSKAVASDWVRQELKLALQKQKEIGRKFLLTVLLENVDMRASLGPSLGKLLDDLVFFDFSKGSRLEASSKVAKFLRDKGLNESDLPPQASLVPVSFSKGVHLNRFDFGKRIEMLMRHMASATSKGGEAAGFLPRQFMVDIEADYTCLKTDLFARIEHVAEEPDYSPQLEEQLRVTLDQIDANERRLVDGLALIANHCPADRIADTAYWFAKIVRARILSRFAQAAGRTTPAVSILADLNQHPFPDSDAEAAVFYGVPEVTPVSIMRNDVPPEALTRKDYLNVLIPTDIELVRILHAGRSALSVAAVYFLTYELLTKYVVPQMLYDYLGDRDYAPLVWDFSGFKIYLN